MGGSSVVESAADLVEALQSDVGEIEVRGTLSGMPLITLLPGVRLRGGRLKFGAKGLRLASDNVVEGVTVLTADDEVAILNDTSVTDLGTLTLRGGFTWPRSGCEDRGRGGGGHAWEGAAAPANLGGAESD